jgi:hypothetical protein
MGRPWKVFVRDIGPMTSFATEDRAHARARDLTAGEYAEVVVWLTGDDPMRRTVYRHDAEPRTEVLSFGRWVEA